MRLPESEYAALEKKKPKYGNRKTVVDGIAFDSQREATRYQHLKWREKAGEISQLRTQVTFDLAPSVVIQGRKRPPLRYIADFVYFDRKTEKYVIEDAKGAKTKIYVAKRHLMKSVHNLDIQEV